MPSRNPRLGLTRLDDRCTPAGLDPTFGVKGEAILDLGGYDEAVGVTVQPDGKFVALTTTFDAGTARTSLVRLNPDGTRDTTFDGDGVVPVPGIVSTGGLGNGPNGVAFGRLADGDYLVVSDNDPTPPPYPLSDALPVPETPDRAVLTLTRYNPDGSVDRVRTLDLGDGSALPGNSLVRADGSVLFTATQQPTAVANGTSLPPSGFASVRRATPDGRLDGTFGGGGFLTINLGRGQPTAAGLQVAPDGGVFVTGTTFQSGDSAGLDGRVTVYVARLTPSGTRDTAYGTDGVFTLSLGNGLGYTGLVATADGGLLLALSAADPTTDGRTPVVRRVTPAGVLDSTYAGDGTLELTSPHFRPGYVGPDEYVSTYGVNLTPTADGGAFALVNRNDGLFVQKLTAAGGVDTRYGRNGLLFLDDPEPSFPGQYFVRPTSRSELAVAVAPDGDLLVAGGALLPSTTFVSDLFVERIAAAAPTPPLPRVPGDANPQPLDGPDFTGDGVGDVLTVSGSRLQLTDGANGSVIAVVAPYEASFTGGLVFATADLNRDGKDEIIVAPDVTGSARVQVYEVVDTGLVVRDNFFAINDPNFRGGARLAAGDVDGDGTPDLIVAAGPGGGPRAAIFNGRGLLGMNAAPPKLVNDFFAFPGEDAARLRDGATVAAGDLTGDGRADLIFGSGPGGAPRVFVLAGNLIAAGRIAEAQAAPLANFFSGGDANSRGGSRVKLSDVNADGRPDLTVTNPATGAVWEYVGDAIPGAVGEPTGRRVDVTS